MWRYSELLPLDGEPTVGRAGRRHAAGPGRSPGGELGVEHAVDQERRRQFPDAVVQGSRGRRGPEQGPRVWLHDGRLRLDGQPGQQRRRQRRRRRAGEPTSSFPPTWNAPRSSAPASTAPKVIGDHGHLRRGQSALHADRVQVRLGLRQHQPHGRSTPRARRRSASRSPSSSAGAMPQHVVCPMAGGSLIGKIHKAFQRTAPRSGSIADADLPDLRRPADRLQSDHRRGQERPRTRTPVRKPNTIAKSLAIGDPADGYFAAKVIRETGGWAEDVSDAEIAEAMELLGPHRGHLRGDGRRRDRRRGPKADRAGPHRRATRKSCCASPATA